MTTAMLVVGCSLTGPTRYHQMARDLEREASASSAWKQEERDPFAGRALLERGHLVELLLERNPTIESARHAWRATLQRFPQVSALQDPIVGYGAAPLSFAARGVDDAHVVDFEQAIPFPGKLGLRGEVALAEAEASRGDFQAVRLRLAAIGSWLFDDHYFAVRAREINAQHIQLLESFQRIALARYEAGQATQQDPLQAETELARLIQRDFEIQTRVRVTRQRINTLLRRGRLDAPLPPPPPTLTPPPVPFAEVSIPPLLAEALVARPELDAAGARVRARQAEVRFATREFLPDFSLVGNYNRRLPISENRPFVGIRLNVPLQLGRRRAALEEARSKLARSKSEQVRIADEVRLAVHQSLDEYEQARAVAGLFEARLLPAARARVGAAQSGFESGRNSFLELIDAERELRRVELDREQAAADVSRRVAQLLLAVGQPPGLAPGSKGAAR